MYHLRFGTDKILNKKWFYDWFYNENHLLYEKVLNLVHWDGKIGLFVFIKRFDIKKYDWFKESCLVL